MGADLATRPVPTEVVPGPARAPRRTGDLVFAVSVALVAVGLFEAIVLRGGGGLLANAAWALAVPLGAAGIVWWYRGRKRAARSSVSLTIGAATLVVAAGMTGPRVMKGGVSLAGVVGLAAAAGGIALLTLGTVTALGGIRRRWLRLVAIPVGLLALYYVITPLTLAVYVTHPAHAVLGERTPADSGVAYRDVVLTTEDGVSLAGWYVPSHNDAAVVLLHGSGSTRTSVLDHLVVLARHGYGVLAVDARGHGESGGTAMDWGWFGDRDVAAAVAFLEGRPEVDPSRIGAVGLSMGGEEALTAAASDRRIAAVVSEGASMRAFSDWPNIPAPTFSRWLSAPFYWVQSAAADLMTGASPPMPLLDAVALIAQRPVLLIAGNAHSELGFNERYAAAAPGSTTLWSLPDTPHVGAIHVHPSEWERRVTEFLDAALLHPRTGP